jgi:hypothetical protein
VQALSSSLSTAKKKKKKKETRNKERSGIQGQVLARKSVSRQREKGEKG